MEGQFSVRPAVSQAITRLHNKKKVCKNYHMRIRNHDFSRSVHSIWPSGRLFKRSLNLIIAYKIKYFELIFCNVSRFQ